LISDRNIGAVVAVGFRLGSGRDVAAAIAVAGIGVKPARNIGGAVALRLRA
jgi:hypothetical protein